MKVSVVTVVLNAEDTIEQTIRSVISQSYEDMEYIIVDGGSTDNTQNIIHRYMDKISVFISEKDQGIYDAMNKGIDCATGDIIGFLNADDWYEPEAVSVIVCNWGDNDVVYGETNLYDKDCFLGKKKSIPLPSIVKGPLPFCHQSAFVRLSLLKEMGGFNTDYKICGDYDFFVKSYVSKKKFFHIDHVIADFRVNGLSNTNVVKSTEEKIEIIKKHFNRADYSVESLERLRGGAYLMEAIRQNDRSVLTLIKEWTKGQSIAVWGLGDWGKRIADYLIGNHYDIVCFYDKNVKDENHTYLDIPICSLNKLNDDKKVLVAIKETDSTMLEYLKERKVDYLTLYDLEKAALANRHDESLDLAGCNRVKI